jgi:hypothetical protein
MGSWHLVLTHLQHIQIKQSEMFRLYKVIHTELMLFKEYAAASIFLESIPAEESSIVSRIYSNRT